MIYIPKDKFGLFEIDQGRVSADFENVLKKRS